MALNIFDENKSASLQVFATEMYEVYSNVSNVVPNIWMIYLGKKEVLYNLRNICHFISGNIKSLYHGWEIRSW